MGIIGSYVMRTLPLSGEDIKHASVVQSRLPGRLPGIHREVICWLIQSVTTRSGRAE